MRGRSAPLTVRMCPVGQGWNRQATQQKVMTVLFATETRAAS